MTTLLNPFCSVESHSGAYYDAYRAHDVNIVETSYPLPGETKFNPIDRGTAMALCDKTYSNAELVAGAGQWGVQVFGRFVATIFSTSDHRPAILHKRQDGSRELNVYEFVLKTA